MRISENKEIKEILAELEEGMLDYLEIAEGTYSKADVKKCMDILNSYLQLMDNIIDKEEAMRQVEKTVNDLNTLNESCDYSLIETDQREDIAEIIILASHLKGFNSRDEDITEEWRDW